MKARVAVLMGALLVLAGSSAWAHEGEMAAGEQELKGEVVDITCALMHGEKGMGPAHGADCGQKCVKSGLPVGLKVGDQIYLATLADHTPANASLAGKVGQQVTVHGQVLERDGQHLVAISRVE